MPVSLRKSYAWHDRRGAPGNHPHFTDTFGKSCCKRRAKDDVSYLKYFAVFLSAQGACRRSVCVASL